ncbi:MAG TPA: hypothetical protein VEB86_15870 [Chryseosolibacter sp.]|nr:hypothetical protein [Chryseosolibacter sp.]
MPALNLIDETVKHFLKGAKSVRAFSADATYIITPVKGSDEFWITIEEDGYKRKKTDSLDEFFQDVFGIQATY